MHIVYCERRIPIDFESLRVKCQGIHIVNPVDTIQTTVRSNVLIGIFFGPVCPSVVNFDIRYRTFVYTGKDNFIKDGGEVKRYTCSLYKCALALRDGNWMLH